MNPALLAIILPVLAMLTQFLTERFFGWFVHGTAMIYLSALVGVGFCLLFQVDALSLLSMPLPIGEPFTGQIITGLIVSAGAVFTHEVFGLNNASEPK